MQEKIKMITKADPANAGLNQEIAILQGKFVSLEIRLNAYHNVLEKWNKIWQWVITFIKNILKGILVWGEDLTPASTQSETSTGDSPIHKQIISKASADFALQAMQLYFLPLIYGFLGASAYILRRLSTEIEKMTYTRESDIRYRLRLTLGSLSGMAIAWFVPPEITPNVFTALSPMAMAFLAGYGVEVLFSLLDGIILKFSSENQPKLRDKPLPE